MNDLDKKYKRRKEMGDRKDDIYVTHKRRNIICKIIK